MSSTHEQLEQPNSFIDGGGGGGGGGGSTDGAFESGR